MKSFDIDNYDGITMREFILNYVGITGLPKRDLNHLFHATHKDLKELGIPGVKCIPNDIVTDEMVCLGYVLLVEDGKSNSRNKRLAPYIRPELVLENPNINITEYVFNKGSKINKNDFAYMYVPIEKEEEEVIADMIDEFDVDFFNGDNQGITKRLKNNQ